MRVVEYLENQAPSDRRLSQEQIAQFLEVSPRTIYNWRRMHPARKIGRPRHAQEIRKIALWRVGRELRRQGYPGWRPIREALSGLVPDRLIQEYVRRFKAKRKLRAERRRLNQRIRIEVTQPGVVWSLDAARLRPTAEEPKPETQVLKDRASRKVQAISLGPPVRGEDVVALLEEAKSHNGGCLPLVLATDNGAPFVCEEVSQYLKREQVVHLRSLPRTPEHNGAVEVGIREIKEQLWNQEDGTTPGLDLLRRRLARAVETLNGKRLRKSLGYVTAGSIDMSNQPGYNQVRESFYRSCSKRIEEAMLGAKGKRAARMAAREAVHASLETMGWIKRWRGGQPFTAIRPENIS